MEEKKNFSRAHVKLYGKVQNVGFRFFINRKASGAGLVGWVRNANGFVEVVLEGDKETIKDCVEECQRGPMFSKVEKVGVDWGQPTGEFIRFEVR